MRDDDLRNFQDAAKPSHSVQQRHAVAATGNRQQHALPCHDQAFQILFQLIFETGTIGRYGVRHLLLIRLRKVFNERFNQEM